MKFIARFAGDSYRPFLNFVLELTVTAALTDEHPTIVFQLAKNFSDFHK